MAATWHLPLIYCLINNGYAISTRCEDAHPQKHLREWADGYEVTNYGVDGNDVEAVVETVEKAAQQCREGKGPVLIEFETYRWQGHFAGDPAAYRPEEEMIEWKKKDPILVTKKVLMERENVSEDELKKIDSDVEAEVNEMLKFSLESPVPEIDMKYAETYGIELKEDAFQLNMEKLQKEKNKIVKTLTGGVGALLKANKVELVMGTAKILSPGKVEVTDDKGAKSVLEAGKILIASGSKNVAPPVKGLDLPGVLSSTEALAMTRARRAPRRIRKE